MRIEDLGLLVNGVTQLYPEKEKKGCATITPYEFDSKDDILFNLRAIRDGGGLFKMYDGDYVKLHVDGELMMSDTAMERKSNKEIVENAKGKVIIAGLGLGVILTQILENENVSKVVVVEKYQDVIDLVKPKFTHPKLEIVNSDIHQFETDETFDTIYLDIWPTISTDNLDEIFELEFKFRKILNIDGYIDSWMKNLLIIDQGIEDGTHCEYCGEILSFEECDYCEE